jgi:pyruvate ferredoxin oxidoreductase alpha subunit
MVDSCTSVMEGSMAVAQAVRAARPGVISAYPITPQTHIVEFLAQMVADGDLDTHYIRADSEFSAASIVCGASAAGVRAYTASASQGLALMTEVIYNMAGMRLPVVLTGANRQLSAPIGLQPDHQDTLLLRDSGLIELYVESAQEAYDTHLQAFRIAEDPTVLLPVIVCMDGYILTHVFEPVRTWPQETVDAFLPPYKPRHWLTPERPEVFGSYTDETNTLEVRYLAYQASLRAGEVIERAARDYRDRFGPYHGGLIDTYAMDDADIALVAMGSMVSTLREAIDGLRARGRKVGLVKVRSYRPFPTAALRQALRGVGTAAVLDRGLSMGFGGILASDVKAALCNVKGAPLVLGLMAGYGGREVTLEGVSEIVTLAERALECGRVDAECAFFGLRPELLPEDEL